MTEAIYNELTNIPACSTEPRNLFSVSSPDFCLGILI